MKRLRLGIIGSGFGLYGLLPAFHSLTNCIITSICGEKTERLLNYCQHIDLKNIYTDWQLMLKKEKLDAIALAVLPHTQYLIGKTAIEKGKHIFAEKPLAANYKEAKILFDLATKRNITHAIDFIFPEINEWKKVKELIDKKTYGNLKYISVNWDFLSYDIKHNISSWKTDVSEGGGALSFYFSHTLYYLEYFAGEISDVKSHFSYSKKSLNGGEVGIDLLLKFKKNINGYAHLRSDVQGLQRHQLLFMCEKGTIILENEGSVVKNFIIKIYTEAKKEEPIQTSPIQQKKDEDERVREVRKLATRFTHACLNNQQMTPSMKDGLRVQELIEKIRLS